jgi:hypothetical protein
MVAEAATFGYGMGGGTGAGGAGVLHMSFGPFETAMWPEATAATNLFELNSGIRRSRRL